MVHDVLAKSRVASGAVGLVVALAVGIYMVTDKTDHVVIKNVCYLGVLVGAGVGAWVGAWRAPRGRRSVPVLIAAGVSLSALADVVWNMLDLRGANTDVSMADPLWFVSYAFLCGALLLVLGRSRGGGRRIDMEFVVDAVTIVIVSVLIFWSISVDTIIADHSVTPFVRAVWAAYPIIDAVVLALVLRILFSRRARAAIGASFATGVCLWLAADIVYLQAPASALVLSTMDAAWMVAPVLVARAAWRIPQIEADTSDSADARGWVWPLAIAVGPLLVPPALEIVADLRGEPDRPFELFAGMAALVMLAFVRTGRLLRSEARAQRALEVARDAALEASRAKTMFLANMSHEIRTPLTTVLAAAEILEDTPLDELQLKLLAKMHRSGNLLMSLVEGVLDFSRVEAGQVELQSVELDLHILVADAVDVYVPRARQAGVRFEWHLDPGVPQMVMGDPTRLLQIVLNLLDNALKFTPHGRVRLVVRPAEGDSVDFIVDDTGIGIRPEDQASVFESFKQVDGSTTRRYGGSGLGLAICKELTELMGGSITVQSQFDSGSTFVVRVPLVIGTADHVVAPASALAGLSAH